jgi:hypothetical protein
VADSAEDAVHTEKFEFVTGSVTLANGENLEIRIVQEAALDLTGDLLQAHTGEPRISIGGAVELTSAQATKLSARILKALDDAEAAGDSSPIAISWEDL